jgi:rSAM/selenodomain-associated transferase 1
MAKAPRQRHVKTRLLTRLTPERATELYRCFLNDTLAISRSLRDVRIALMCPAGDREELAALAGSDIDVVAQAGQGLAAGLHSAFEAFAKGFDRIVAFNADSPHLPPSWLNAAFEALDTHDTVVGPTADGGYYLVGATRAHPGLFDGDGLGTTQALDALVARVRARALTLAVLPAWYDVDVPADLVRLEEDLRAVPERAPLTAALLAGWADGRAGE